MGFLDDVALGLGPAVFAIVSMPTLREMQGLEPRRPYTVKVDLEFAREYLVCSAKQQESGHWWNVITYAFFHENMNHMSSNLAMLIPAGFSVTHEFGKGGFWWTFLGGCVLGALNFGDAKTRQQKLAIKSYLKNGSAKDPTGAANYWFTQFVENGVEASASFLAPYVSKYTEYVGCSAGCCALLGVDFCISMSKLISTLYSKSNGEDDDYYVSEDEIFHAISCYFTLQLFYEEWQAFQHTGSRDGKDHAGHVLGLGFGFLSYGLFQTYRSLRWLAGGGSSRKRRLSK